MQFPLLPARNVRINGNQGTTVETVSSSSSSSLRNRDVHHIIILLLLLSYYSENFCMFSICTV